MLFQSSHVRVTHDCFVSLWTHSPLRVMQSNKEPLRDDHVVLNCNGLLKLWSLKALRPMPGRAQREKNFAFNCIPSDRESDSRSDCVCVGDCVCVSDCVCCVVCGFEAMVLRPLQCLCVCV